MTLLRQKQRWQNKVYPNQPYASRQLLFYNETLFDKRACVTPKLQAPVSLPYRPSYQSAVKA